MYSITDSISQVRCEPYLYRPSKVYAKEAPLMDVTQAIAQRDQVLLTWYMAQEQWYLDRRQQVAKMLSALLDILSSSRSLLQALDYIVSQTEPLLNATASALYRIDFDHDDLVVQSSWGLPASFVLFGRMSIVGTPAVQAALAENRPILLPSLVRDPLCLDVESPSCRQMLLESGTYTLLIVPLTVDEQRYGALFLYFVDQFDFSEADLRLAMLFGHKAACAIESALAWQSDAQPTSAVERKDEASIING